MHAWIVSVSFSSSSFSQESLQLMDKSSPASKSDSAAGFQMPLHYPRYTKADYEKMEEWRLDLLLKQYGLVAVSNGTLEEKRAYAIGAFLWPDQY
ncbi:PREDICTED: uncharacterized protein LOC101291127 [Fragaria vesca subsp. vesca]